MAPDPTKKKRSIHQEKSNHKSEEVDVDVY